MRIGNVILIAACGLIATAAAYGAKQYVDLKKLTYKFKKINFKKDSGGFHFGVILSFLNSAGLPIQLRNENLVVAINSNDMASFKDNANKTIMPNGTTDLEFPFTVSLANLIASAPEIIKDFDYKKIKIKMSGTIEAKIWFLPYVKIAIDIEDTLANFLSLQ